MGAKANYRLFRSLHESWDTMCRQVAEFLTEIGPDKVIGVSHSQEGSLGVITVWYWE